MSQQPPHPGYGPTPPQEPARHPGYGPTPPTTPSYPAYGSTPPPPTSDAHPGYGPTPTGAHPGYGSAPTGQGPGARSAAARNPLGLASLILGAIPSLLGLVFTFIQAGVWAYADSSTFGMLSGVQTTLVGLLGLGALILGLVALARRGAPKALAAAGTALGAATLVGVLGSLLYPLIMSAAYGW